MRETRLTPRECVQCGYRMDAASGLNAKQPDEGSVSICLRCGHLSFFTADLTLREPTEAELADLLKDPTIAAVLLSIIALNRSGQGVR